MLSLRLSARVALVCLSGLLVSGCASRMPSFQMPLFGGDRSASLTTQSVTSKANFVAPGQNAGAPAVAGYSSERAYYEAYVRNGYRHPKGLSRPFSGETRQASAPVRDTFPAVTPKRVRKGKASAVGLPRVAGKPFQVQEGDTLNWIARVHNVPMAQLMRVNGLRSRHVQPGRVIIIPDDIEDLPTDEFAETPKSADAFSDADWGQPVVTANSRRSTRVARSNSAGRVSGDGRSYVVAPGDTFYSIATRHRVDPMKLADLNRIDDTSSVRPGQRLQLPESW